MDILTCLILIIHDGVDQGLVVIAPKGSFVD